MHSDPPPAPLALVAPTDASIAPEAALEVSGLLSRADERVRKGGPKATRRAYAADWKGFQAWTSSRGLPSLPAHPLTIIAYVKWLSEQGRKVSTIERALSGIWHFHEANGHEPPRSEALRKTMKAIRQDLGSKRSGKKPISAEQLLSMVKDAPLQERALLLVGWFGAFRRSELSALEPADLSFVPEGLIVLVRKSKMDQEGRGAEVGIPYASNHLGCPVRTMQAYMASLAPGARLFPAPRAIATIVQRAAVRAGLGDKKLFGAHSLRRGLATSAAAKGRSTASIMKQGRWRSETVARGYIEHGSLFIDNAATGLL